MRWIIKKILFETREKLKCTVGCVFKKKITNHFDHNKNLKLSNEENYTENLIYHYCSVDTFMKIAESKKLWLSDAALMNDRFEAKWADKIVLDILDEVDNNENNNFKLEYQAIASKKHYLCSFSKNDDLLSQWRAYGNDGSGIAIGFNIRLFPDILQVYSKSPGTNNGESSTHIFGYEDVVYSDDFLKSYIRDILWDEENSSGENFKGKALIIKELSTTMKHPSFIEESEVRLSYTPANNMHNEADNSLNRLSKVKFRHSNDKVISYFEFNFSSKYNSLIVPEVILGPKCTIDKSVIKLFLKSNGFEVTEVKNSQSSYRGNQ